MVTAADFELQRLMASGFAVGDGLDPSTALRQILQEWGHTYDGEATALQLPPEVPPDVPSVILTSRNGASRIEVSRTRVNLTWLRTDAGRRSLRAAFSDFGGKLVRIFEEQEAGLGRLAAVAARRTTAEEPGRVLSRQFCRERWLRGPLNRPEGFELHAHKTFQLLPDLTVNSWFRIKTAKGESGEYRHIAVEQDINTLAEEMESRRFSRKDTRRMLRAAASELDAILDMYFPAS